jgi:hypothetical protein
MSIIKYNVILPVQNILLIRLISTSINTIDVTAYVNYNTIEIDYEIEEGFVCAKCVKKLY